MGQPQNNLMKRQLLALFILCLVACGGGGSDPVKPTQNQQTAMVVPSGTFAITATLVINGCNRSDVWDGNYDVVIDGTSFTMGQFVGTWTASTHLARGEGTKSVHMVRDCTVTDQALCYFTFSSKDSFYGTIIYRHSIKGDCTSLQSCSTTWRVLGTRVVTP
jgi:hypothetical protein